MGNCCSGEGASQAKSQDKPKLELPKKPAPKKPEEPKKEEESDKSDQEEEAPPEEPEEQEEEPPKERLEALNSEEWKGYYIQGGNKHKMPKFSLVFAEEVNEEGLLTIEAEGEDVGEYKINGTFNPEDNTATLVKDYGEWTTDVSLTWNEERNGFEGTFSVAGSEGEWFIKPVAEESSGSESD